MIKHLFLVRFNCEFIGSEDILPENWYIINTSSYHYGYTLIIVRINVNYEYDEEESVIGF